MSWISSDINPTDSKSEKFIDLYNQRVRQTARNVNDYRLEQYSNKDKLFEIDLDLIGRDSSQFHIPQLPFSNIRHLITRNANIWKTEIYRAIHEKESNIDVENVSALKAVHNPEYRLIYWSDYSINENKLHIKDIHNNIYTYTLQFGSSIIGEIPNDSILKLYPDERRVEIKTDQNSEQSIDLSNLDLEQRDVPHSYNEHLVKILSVYYDIYPSAQIDGTRNDPIEYEQLFEMLGVLWREPTPHTYLITKKEPIYEEINKFLETPRERRSLTEYYNILGYPSKDAKRLDGIQKEYDELSGEEFILYGLQKGIISPELASYISYIPYRPYPSIESVYTALAESKDKLDKIEGYPLPDSINKTNTHEIIREYKKDRTGAVWNILDVENMLL